MAEHHGERFIGVDSRPSCMEYELNGVCKSFRTVTGAAVVTDDYQKFKKTYKTVTSKCFKELKINSQRQIMSSQEILDLTQGDYSLLERIYDEIVPHVYRMNIFYTSFNSRRIPKVKTHGRTYPGKEMTPLEFLDYLHPSLPHLCVWRIYKYVKDTKATVFLDSFGGTTTEAWEEIKDCPGIKILFNGDKCNPLVAFADILLKVLEHRLKTSRKSYFEDNIRQVLQADRFDYGKFMVHILHNRHYPKITPLDHRGFNLVDKINHPL